MNYPAQYDEIRRDSRYTHLMCCVRPGSTDSSDIGSVLEQHSVNRTMQPTPVRIDNEIDHTESDVTHHVRIEQDQ